MLFTDSDHITQADLVAIDPEAPDNAAADSVTLATVFRQGWQASADALVEVMTPGYGWYPDPVLAAHTNTQIAPVQLSRIVVTSAYANRQSALGAWMAWKALEALYAALATRRDASRYDAKLVSVQAGVRRAWRTLFATGVGVVAAPLPCPGAVHELGAGDFGSSNAVAGSGGSLAAGDYDVAITWLDADGVESGPSQAVTVTVGASGKLTVGIAGLGAPGVVVVPRLGAYALKTATRWNVYAGVTGGTKYLQNVSPLALSTLTYDVTALLTATAVGTGQIAQGVYQFQRVAGRG